MGSMEMEAKRRVSPNANISQGNEPTYVELQWRSGRKNAAPAKNEINTRSV
jgi:hypothetical protein